MKKIICTLILIMAIGFNAWGLEVINDDGMDDITAQAGVSIFIDNVEIFFSIAKFEYTDTDAGGGTFGLRNVEKTTRINAIGGSIDDVGSAARYGLAADVTPHALTIDIASVASLQTNGVFTAGGAAALGGASSAVIVIGLPTVEITTSEFIRTPYLSNGTQETEFCTITIGERIFAILDGELYVAAH